MDWQAYATKVDADLETAEENNKQLKQEVRGLQKQLIETKSAKSDPKSETKLDPDVEHKLAKVQREVDTNKEKYIKHLNNLHGQLVDAGQARDAAVNQASQAEHGQRKLREELEATHAALENAINDIQHLKERITEQDKFRQQTQLAHSKTTPGAVTYKERLAVVERQLKIEQRENARLQNLSNCNPDKPYTCDDSDDSEPEYPKPQAPIAKKAPPPSKLLAPPCRPENYSRSPQPTVTPKPAAFPNAPQTPRPAGTPRPAARPNAVATPKPVPSPKPATPAKVAPASVDLTMSDDEDEAPLIERHRQKPAGSTRLPIRTSLHESIAVADHSPQTPALPQTPAPPPTLVAKSSSPMSVPGPSPPTSVHGFLPPQRAPPTTSPKRKRKGGAQETPSSAKRRRSRKEIEEEEMRNELSELNITGFGFDSISATGPTTKRISSSATQDTTTTSTATDTDADDLAFATAPMDFTFKAICTYRDPNTISDAFDSRKLKGVAADLWDRIEHVQNIWEGHYGEDWQHEFTKPGANPKEKYFCVTRKCQRKRTNYGKDREPGMFACVDCVKAGLPCFTHTWPTETRSEFQLLPLHEKDRGKPVGKDKEVEWWIKSGLKLPESEDEMEY